MPTERTSHTDAHPAHPDRPAHPGAARPAASAVTPATAGPVPFADALDVAARIAVLSPSSHNCQPWALAWARGSASRAVAARLLAGPGGEPAVGGGPAPGGEDGDGTCEYLVLGLDRDRSLRSLPAHAVEMLLSCGLYGQLLLRALDAQGWTADALRFAAGPAEGDPAPGMELPGTAWPRAWAALCVARLRPTARTATGTAAWTGTGTAARTGTGTAAWTATGTAARTGTGPAARTPTGPAERTGEPAGKPAGKPIGELTGQPPGEPTGQPPGEPAGELAALRATARARRTNRAPYRPHPVRPALLDGLTTPSGCGAARGAEVGVRHLTSEADRAAFADLVARYGGRDFSHRAAWRETHAYLRPTAAAAAARGDGFALDQLFGPLPWPRRQALRVALAPATMRLLGRAGYDRLLARRLADVVRPTPAVVAMSFTRRTPTAGGAPTTQGAPTTGRTPAPEDTPTLADAVKGGARLADYWLCATRAGLALHPVSVVLQHDDVRAALQSRLGIPGRAFFVSRVGWPTAEFPSSPRRPAGASIRTI
ncbi:hypothetical protein GPA10_10240 [Streptomyces sp. p1417]|uniref:RedV protein n=1 Tax=Streptomyces typhae TaxID=2681492 RepID=A0A6L6WVC0_9ACTN|nr:hypothetical protein [Streptomyces typhae]MVO85124.1 hypothetical protein [Streptomyces typhae]